MNSPVPMSPTHDDLVEERRVVIRQILDLWRCSRALSVEANRGRERDTYMSIYQSGIEAACGIIISRYGPAACHGFEWDFETKIE